MVNEEQIRTRLTIFRERCGYSHAEAATLLNISVPHYWDLETIPDAVADTLNVPMFFRLCDVMRIQPHDLLALEDMPPLPPVEGLREVLPRAMQESSTYGLDPLLLADAMQKPLGSTIGIEDYFKVFAFLGVDPVAALNGDYLAWQKGMWE